MNVSGPLEILLVEDDIGMAMLAAERVAEVEGWNVTTTHSAAECRARIADQAVDVVLLDRGLPDCDGAELIGEVLTINPDVAIVMLTGADSAASATETLRLGAWDYVVKQPSLDYLDELPGIISRCAERLALRREQARLRAEMQLLLTAIRGAADAVIITEADGAVRFWNAAAERLFGWSAEEVQGAMVPLVPAAQEAEFANLGECARRGEPLVGVETTCQHRDGSVLEVGLTLTAVRGPDGSVSAYVAVFRDISERKRLEQVRADFAAMFTHDIKDPLASIRGFASILTTSDLSAEQTECAAGIERAAEMIDALVTDFLLAATIESGKLTLVRERLAVADLLRNSSDRFRVVAKRCGINLEMEGNPSGLFISGDRMQLERALSNLVGNAIKYTPAGGTVIMDVLREGEHVLLQVRDTGPGIPPEELSKAFDKYRRVKGTERLDGTGLGLFIVRNLVEAHGGIVTASSQVGRGSTFVIDLPLSVTGATGPAGAKADESAPSSVQSTHNPRTQKVASW